MSAVLDHISSVGAVLSYGQLGITLLPHPRGDIVPLAFELGQFFYPLFNPDCHRSEQAFLTNHSQGSGVQFLLLPSLFLLVNRQKGLKIWGKRANQHCAAKLPPEVGQRLFLFVNHLWRHLLVDVKSIDFAENECERKYGNDGQKSDVELQASVSQRALFKFCCRIQIGLLVLRYDTDVCSLTSM